LFSIERHFPKPGRRRFDPDLRKETADFFVLIAFSLSFLSPPKPHTLFRRTLGEQDKATRGEEGERRDDIANEVAFQRDTVLIGHNSVTVPLQPIQTKAERGDSNYTHSIISITYYRIPMDFQHFTLVWRLFVQVCLFESSLHVRSITYEKNCAKLLVLFGILGTTGTVLATTDSGSTRRFSYALQV
jgi:hypothetical protein